jgi:hypothetical protein
MIPFSTLFIDQRILWRAVALVTVSSIWVLGACGRPEMVEERLPLVSGSQKPLVLTEAADVSPPPSLAPNRLIRGWWPYKRRGEPRLGIIDSARLQGVNLTGVNRRLVLEGENVEQSGEVEVRIAGGEWKPQPLSHRLIIPLPRDLPIGRFLVDVRVPVEGAFGLEKAWFSKAAEPGEVEFIDDDIVQSGFSLVEIVRQVGERSTLTGSFRPPEDADPKQRFSVLVSSRDGVEEQEVFSWSRSTAGAGQVFSTPLGDSGRVRVRLLATGAGPPARWDDMAITTTRPAPVEEEEVAPPAPPRVVVLYIMDALRGDYVGHLGGPAGISPVIDALASEGATFRRHFSIAPNTVPSMKSLFTGRVFLDTGGSKGVS